MWGPPPPPLDSSGSVHRPPRSIPGSQTRLSDRDARTEVVQRGHAAERTRRPGLCAGSRFPAWACSAHGPLNVMPAPRTPLNAPPPGRAGSPVGYSTTGCRRCPVARPGSHGTSSVSEGMVAASGEARPRADRCPRPSLGLFRRGQQARVCAYSLVVDTETTGLYSYSPEGLVTFSRNLYSVRGSRPSTTCFVAYPLDGRRHVPVTSPALTTRNKPRGERRALSVPLGSGLGCRQPPPLGREGRAHKGRVARGTSGPAHHVPSLLRRLARCRHAAGPRRHPPEKSFARGAYLS